MTDHAGGEFVNTEHDQKNVAMAAARMLDRYGQIHWVNNTATTRQTHKNLASVEHMKSQGETNDSPFPAIRSMHRAHTTQLRRVIFAYHSVCFAHLLTHAKQRYHESSRRSLESSRHL